MHINLMRDSALLFPKLRNVEDIRSMKIWHCKYKTLAPIAECRHLEELVIASYPDKTLQCIGAMRELRYLSILHMPRITSLEELSSLSELRSLSLQSLPSWDASRKMYCY